MSDTKTFIESGLLTAAVSALAGVVVFLFLRLESASKRLETANAEWAKLLREEQSRRLEDVRELSPVLARAVELLETLMHRRRDER